MESETEKESKNENGKVYDKMFRREIELSDDESVTVIIDQVRPQQQKYLKQQNY